MANLASLKRTLERLQEEQANHNRIQEGKLSGTVTAGVLGEIPLILIDEPMPKLQNNGYAVFTGMPKVHVAGLSAVLPSHRHGNPQGHVRLRFTCGKEFGTYAFANPAEVYLFC